MTAKNYICILAGAALLVSCTEVKKNEAPTSPHGPMPSPVPLPGKRTETGTVISFTSQQIKLQLPGKGTWIINVTASTKVTGTLSVGSTVTVESNEADWHKVSA